MSYWYCAVVRCGSAIILYAKALVQYCCIKALHSRRTVQKNLTITANRTVQY